MWVGVAFGRIALSVARDRGKVHGIRLVSISKQVSARDAGERLGAAMELLRVETAPLYRRCCAVIDHFIVWDGTLCSTDRCQGVMVAARALNKTNADLAVTIVHEATHLRLEAAGCRSTYENRPRLEEICSREADWVRRRLGTEQSFMEPPGGARMEAEEIAEYRRQHDIELARSYGYPTWLARLITWLRDGPSGHNQSSPDLNP